MTEQFYKIMWVFEPKEIVWDMQTEEPIPLESKLYQKLSRQFYLKEWLDEFTALYNKWLDEDNPIIHNINSSINRTVIDFLVDFNQSLDRGIKVFYWFDVDRDKHPHFKWKKCPLSGIILKDFGSDFPDTNRLVSTQYPLVFPLS